MKKIFSLLFSSILLVSILVVPASAYSENSLSSVPSLEALISGQVDPVNEDPFGMIHVSVSRDTENTNSPQSILSTSDVTVDIRQLSNNGDADEYLLRAYTPLEKSDSNNQGGPLAFFEVTYIRTNFEGYSHVKVLSMRSGWRSTSISNRAMVNLDMSYLADGEYYEEETGTPLLAYDVDAQSRVSSPNKGVAYLFVPNPTRFFNEDSLSQINCTARYDVENTSTSAIVEEDCAIYIQFGEISLPDGSH